MFSHILNELYEYELADDTHTRPFVISTFQTPSSRVRIERSHLTSRCYMARTD